MGFTAAASWAQGFNEAIVGPNFANLPTNQRLCDGLLPPEKFPIWASILDDFWGLEEVDDMEDPPGEVHNWMDEVANCWESQNVVEHKAKAVNGKAVAECQGFLVEGNELWAGASITRRFRLIEAGLYLVGQPRPFVKAIERWIGKASSCQSAQP